MNEDADRDGSVPLVSVLGLLPRAEIGQRVVDGWVERRGLVIGKQLLPPRVGA